MFVLFGLFRYFMYAVFMILSFDILVLRFMLYVDCAVSLCGLKLRLLVYYVYLGIVTVLFV